MEENQPEKPIENNEPILKVVSLESPKVVEKPKSNKYQIISIILLITFLLVLCYVAYQVTIDHCGMCQEIEGKRCIDDVDIADIMQGDYNSLRLVDNGVIDYNTQL